MTDPRQALHSVCKHDRLRRQCDECDMAEEIERLKADRLRLALAVPPPRVILMLSTALSHHPTLNEIDRGDAHGALFDAHTTWVELANRVMQEATGRHG